METAELPTIPPKIPVQPFRDKETARLNGILSGKLRRERAAAKRGTPVQTVQTPAEPVDRFTERRLLRVRKQLNLIDDEVERLLAEISAATDIKLIAELHAKVKMLVESSSRLSEQERFLANRPGPGTRKPKAEPTKRQSQSSEPIEE